MRADRLLALVMVLRARHRVTSAELAAELEVSDRTVLRDIAALSAAGVPVYAERGRNGGFALVDGWTTDLSGLSGSEARSLLVARSSTAAELGLGPSFATGLAKVLSSLPGGHRRVAEQESARILVVDDGYLRGREPVPMLAIAQRAVTAGRRLQISYQGNKAAAPGRRTVDPAGLVCAGGTWYLLASHRHQRRTFRVSRIADAKVPDDPVDRSGQPDVAQWWAQSRAEFSAQLPVLRVELIVDDVVLDRLTASSAMVLSSTSLGSGRSSLTAAFSGLGHAVGELWKQADHVEVLAPQSVRGALAQRAHDAWQQYN